MVRPERLRSELSEASPVDYVRRDLDAAKSDLSVARAAYESTAARKAKRSYYLFNDTIDDLLNAAEALSATRGAPRGPSDLVDTAIQAYLQVLRDEFNGGNEFPMRTGPLQRGPRIR